MQLKKHSWVAVRENKAQKLPKGHRIVLWKVRCQLRLASINLFLICVHHMLALFNQHVNHTSLVV